MDPSSVAKNISDSHYTSVELLITDIHTALTLLDLASTTKVEQDRLRRIQEAQHAYDSALHFRERLTATPEQSKKLNKGLATLEARLRSVKTPIAKERKERELRDPQ